MLKLVVCTGLLLSVPAVAQTTQGSSNTASKPTQATADPNKVICETEQQIGSRLASKRICMTAAQWKEHELQVHQQLDEQHTETQPSPGL